MTAEHPDTSGEPPPEGSDPAYRPGRSDEERLGEEELLAAFDRRSPQGSLRWGFDDALRRVEQPDVDSAAGAAPWPGLPDDLWDRGRSARIGQRFVGDVAGVLADILAADARTAADAAVTAVNGDRFVATWDALRFLAARVELLESRTDPVGLEAAEWPGPVPDPSQWVEQVVEWLGPVTDAALPVIVGEAGEGSLVEAVHRSGRAVVGVEPRGGEAWRFIDAARFADQPAVSVILDEVEASLRRMPADSAAGIVLAGCVDRLDLPAQVRLVEEAVRVTRPGGTLVVLATDQGWWGRELTAPARDLAPGRPLHPETWIILLRRAGASQPVWHQPRKGTLHAIVAQVER